MEKVFRNMVIFLFVIFFLFPIIDGSAKERGVVEEILDILKDKKVISNQKYDELKKRAEAEEIKEIASAQKLKEIAKDSKIPASLKGLKIGALWYLDYKAGEEDDDSYNGFSITRGYLDIKKELTPWLSLRFTPDIKRKSDGDLEMRIKYLYARIHFPDIGGLLTENFVEIGQIHMPWLDFEEHINPYRCQGTMFLERNHMFNSADQGIALFGYFGGEMNEDFQKNVNHHYAGYYGSYSLGVFNGGGYHAGENNNNKTVEGRVTLRPFPELLPGLQISYFGIYGKGNLKEDEEYYFRGTFLASSNIKRQLSSLPKWWANTAYISYEAPFYSLAFQYGHVKGSQKGLYKYDDKNVVDERQKRGFSVFAMVRVPQYEQFRIWGRYDIWDPDTSNSSDIERRSIFGISYDLYKENMLLFAYENTSYDEKSPDDSFFQTVFQVKF
ncbi:MAG: hypothetical protein SV062_00435 [Thermodesulfobacteriota bacterium]|nr:hypothetical protein [Thermodesulfobacteriota bacterium]